MRTNMEKLIVQMFERKRCIIEHVKQQMDLYDQHLASKCLLEGVSPPDWLWLPSFPSQTSAELNKEEIISELLFPHSRPSIICPSSRRFSYQQPIFSADNVKTLEVTSAVNQSLDKHLLAEDFRYLSENNLEDIGCAPDSGHERDPYVASSRDFQEERVVETAATCCEQNASSPFPGYSQADGDKKSAAAVSCAQGLDFTTPGYSQGERVPNSVSTSGCEQDPRIVYPRYCRDEAAPDSCPDPALSLSRIQRSKSRQRALELRSSGKASKSHSNRKCGLQASPSENVGFEIPSLRSYDVNETELFERDEKDDGRRGEEDVHNSNTQSIEKFRDVKSSTTVESRSPCEKEGLSRKSTGVKKYASVALSIRSISPHESRPMNEIAIFPPINSGREGFSKDEEKVRDPQSKICNEIVYPDEVTRSKNLTPGYSSKSEHSNFSHSFPGDNLSRSSNASCKSGHEVELPQRTSGSDKFPVAKQARMSNLQSVKVYSGRTTRSRNAAQGYRAKSEHSGYVKSSPVKLQSGHAAELLQSDDKSKLLMPSAVNAEGLLVEEDNISDKQRRENGESVDTGRLLRSRSLSQAGICRDESVVVSEAVLLENWGLCGDLVEHSTSDVSSGVKVANPQSLYSKAESSPFRCRMTSKGSSSRQQELSKECKVPSPSSELQLVAEQIEVRAEDSASSPLHELPVPEKPKPHHSDDKEEHNLDQMGTNRQEEPSKGESHLLISSAKEIDEKPLLGEVTGPLEENDDLKEVPLEANIGLPVNEISICRQDPLTNSLKKRDSLLLANASSDVLAKLQDPDKLCPSESLKEPSLSILSYMNANKESKISFEEDVGLLDVLKQAKSASTKSRPDKIIAGNIGPSMVEWNQSSDYFCSYEPAMEKSLAAFCPRLIDDSLRQKMECPQHQAETSTGQSCSPNNRNLACLESGDFDVPERSIQAFCSSSPIFEGSQQQNKRRRTLDNPIDEMSSSAKLMGDVLDSDLVKKKPGTSESSRERHNLDQCDVELQKMIGSASSTELQLEEGHLLKEAGVDSPATFFLGLEQFVRERSQITLHHGVRSWDTDFMPCAGETSHLLASGGLHDYVGSPHFQPIGLTGSDDESLPVLEGFVIQTDTEKQSESGAQTSLDSLKLPKATLEGSNILEQICRSTTNTPLLHLPATLNFEGRPDLNKSVPNGLLEGMYLSDSLSGKDDVCKKLGASSLFGKLGIEHAFHGRSHSDCLPLSGAKSSADTRDPCASPIRKLWYGSLTRSASSKKRGNSSPGLPCIDEENENIDEEAEKPLYRSSPRSAGSEKSGSSSPELRCIDEENENIGQTAVKKASAERKPLAVVNKNMEFRESVSDAKMLVDRQSLESVRTAFSFTANTCNSVKRKLGNQNGGKRRCTSRGKENQAVSQGANVARKNVDQLKNRFSKPKLSENSSLTTQGPRLSVKEPRHNNIVSNLTSFIPLVQPNPAAAVVTGKRDVKVKALGAAEAAKRQAEKKENERRMKKEVLKLERAKQEKENLRKQELEKKKKVEERKKKEAEMVERKRLREEEEKKLKEAKRKRVAEAHRQQREAGVKTQAEKGGQELKTQATDVKTNAQKEIKDEPGNAENKMQEQANYRIREGGSKTSGASKSNADDSKGSFNPGKVSGEAIYPNEIIEESYDISPYKCSDDEEEDEDEDVPNTKFVPAWASKKCVFLTIGSQQNIDPEKIFPPKSFCSIGEVLVPRKLQLK